MEGLFRPLLAISVPFWVLILLIFVVWGAALASVVLGIRIGNRQVGGRAEKSSLDEKRPVQGANQDYIGDSVMTQESIRRDREGRRVISTTKED